MESNDLKGQTDQKTRAYLLMIERIEAMRLGILPKAVNGDAWAVYCILKCNDQETKLLDLLDDKQEKISHENIEICWEEDEPIEWLSTGECAEILGVTAKTVGNAVRNGSLPASRTNGDKYRINRKDLLRYKDSGALNCADESDVFPLKGISPTPPSSGRDVAEACCARLAPQASPPLLYSPAPKMGHGQAASPSGPPTPPLKCEEIGEIGEIEEIGHSTNAKRPPSFVER
jgi:excisionase family DNA binding protein